MSEADDNWFIQNSRFIYERNRNTLINTAERRGREEVSQYKAVEDALMIINEFKALCYTESEYSFRTCS